MPNNGIQYESSILRYMKEAGLNVKSTAGSGASHGDGDIILSIGDNLYHSGLWEFMLSLKLQESKQNITITKKDWSYNEDQAHRLNKVPVMILSVKNDPKESKVVLSLDDFISILIKALK